MPHLHDKAKFAAAMELLDGPKHLHYAARSNGRRVVDAETKGQQCFQALLFECLHSERGRHPFDSTKVRPFADTRDGYLGWVSPQFAPERLIIHCTLASRVTAFLLPHSRIFPDGSCEYAGIPGLRVDDITSGLITLKHLPTGGILQLHEYGQSAQKLSSAVKAELRDTGVRTDRIARDGGHVALWALKDLDPTELAAESYWAASPVTTVLSGLMARATPLWRRTKALTVRTPRRSSSALRLEWRGDTSAEEIAEILTGPVIGFRESSLPQDMGVAVVPDPVLVLIDGVQVELDAPWRPRSLLGRSSSGVDTGA